MELAAASHYLHLAHAESLPHEQRKEYAEQVSTAATNASCGELTPSSSGSEVILESNWRGHG